MEVKILYLENYPSEKGELKYAHDGDSGVDLRAAIKADNQISVKPGQTMLVPTGVKVELPHGYEIQVRPRSGLALKHGITVLNTPGTVDSGYRGEIGVILINHSEKVFVINRGDKIAQAVVCAVIKAAFVKADELSDTSRGNGAYNSTGKN